MLEPSLVGVREEHGRRRRGPRGLDAAAPADAPNADASDAAAGDRDGDGTAADDRARAPETAAVAQGRGATSPGARESERPGRAPVDGPAEATPAKGRAALAITPSDRRRLLSTRRGCPQTRRTVRPGGGGGVRAPSHLLRVLAPPSPPLLLFPDAPHPWTQIYRPSLRRRAATDLCVKRHPSSSRAPPPPHNRAHKV